MKILVMVRGYFPEKTGIGKLTTELCEYLATRGHEVSVVAAFPHFPEWRIMDTYRGRMFAHEIINGVSVRRGYTWVPDRQTTKNQMVYDCSFCVTALLSGLIEREIDLILAISPPLQLGLVAHVLSRIKRIPFVLAVRDLLPDIAIELGILKNRLAITFGKAMEQFVYTKASRLIVLCDSFADSLRRRKVANHKILVLSDWVDTTLIRPVSRDNPWRKSHGIREDQYVVLYTGNIGIKEGLENVIETASLLSNHNDVSFLLVGEGMEKVSLRRKVSEMGLRNVKFLHLQPESVFPQMLAAADILVLNLRASLVNTCIPAKLLTYMAAGRPIIASVHPDSEVARHIRAVQCGLLVPAERPDLLAAAALKLKDNREMGSRLGRNGRAFAEEHFARQKVLAQFAVVLEEVVRSCVG